ncbi:MAG: BatA and WFA domain-containing protein [Planctomycetes bacterium]|nr:BatA and WFA domain-containing protein [Planctomycetota bacterium]
MNVLNPAFLALGALAIPLILLYVLKLRRRDVTVSSTLLWQKAVRDLQANAPFQRLRANLLLLLQLLLLALLVVALARPALLHTTSPGKVVVLVIDTSASMGAKAGSGTRLDLAKKEAVRVLSSLADADEAMVVEASGAARVVTGLTRDRAATERAIALLSTHDTEAAIEEALRLAATAVEKRDGAAVILLSDGAGAKIPSHPVLENGLTWVKTGEKADNVGITACRAVTVVDPDGRVKSRIDGKTTLYAYSVFAGVSNFSETRKKVYASLKLDGQAVAARAIELAPGETSGASFELMLPGEAAVEVALDEPDALAADDHAWTRLPAPGEIKVAFIGENRFLRAFLQSRPRVTFVTENPDLWICEGTASEPPTNAHAVWFRPDKPVAGIVPGEESERVRVLSWDETHPLLRFARFTDVHVGHALRLTPPPEGTILVQGSAGPLIVSTTDRGRLRIAVGFKAADSDWPLRPSFPIFFANLLRAVSDARAAEVPAQVQGGKPAQFVVPGISAAKIVSPDGGSETLTASSAGDFVWPDTSRVGLYSFETAAGSRPFGINLLSETESNLAPPAALGSGKSRVAASPSAGRENRDLWPWFAGAALVLFLVEWACFHRRVA